MSLGKKKMSKDRKFGIVMLITLILLILNDITAIVVGAWQLPSLPVIHISLSRSQWFAVGNWTFIAALYLEFMIWLWRP